MCVCVCVCVGWGGGVKKCVDHFNSSRGGAVANHSFFWGGLGTVTGAGFILTPMPLGSRYSRT